MADRETTIYVAKLAAQAERYDYMVEAMRNVVKMGEELTAYERIMLLEAYKKKIYFRRASRRILSSMMKEEPECDTIPRINEYRMKVEKEISDIRTEVVSLIDEHLIPSCRPGDHASTVFYLKMKGDFYRYQAELRIDNDQSTEELVKAYEAATTIAEGHLPPTDPIRLGLALNYAVYYYDICLSTERATKIAKKALREAMSRLRSSNEELCKDSVQIMGILRDNMMIWQPEISGGDVAGNNDDNYHLLHDLVHL